MKSLAQGHTASKWKSWDSNSVLSGLFCSTAQAWSWSEGCSRQQGPQHPAPQRKQVERDSIAGSINNMGSWALLAVQQPERVCVIQTALIPCQLNWISEETSFRAGRPN